jgi:hypothetical protein
MPPAIPCQGYLGVSRMRTPYEDDVGAFANAVFFSTFLP